MGVGRSKKNGEWVLSEKQKKQFHEREETWKRREPELIHLITKTNAAWVKSVKEEVKSKEYLTLGKMKDVADAKVRELYRRRKALELLQPICFINDLDIPKEQVEFLCKLFPRLRPVGFFNRIRFIFKKSIPGASYKLNFVEKDYLKRRGKEKVGIFFHSVLFAYVALTTESNPPLKGRRKVLQGVTLGENQPEVELPLQFAREILIRKRSEVKKEEERGHRFRCLREWLPKFIFLGRSGGEAADIEKKYYELLISGWRALG